METKTIILFLIITLGIILLISITFFAYKSTFSDVGSQQKAVNKATLKQLRTLFSDSDDPVALVSNSVTIAQGDSEDFAVGFKNVGTNEGDFSYREVWITPSASVTKLFLPTISQDIYSSLSSIE